MSLRPETASGRDDAETPSLMPLVFLMALLLASSAAHAQIAIGPDATFGISGGIQPRASFGVQHVGAENRVDRRLGFGLRRARVQFNLTYRDQVGLEYDMDLATGDVRSVDLFAFYNVADNVQLRVGRMPVAQPRAFVPTSNSRIDAVDRAAIAERWDRATLASSGRDFGAEVEVAAGATELLVSVHNGTGGFSREVDNFRESGSAESVTRGGDRTALAAGAAVHHEAGRGVSFGGFAGFNVGGTDQTVVETPAGEEIARGYATAAAHLYWGERPGSQPVRLKLDALGIQYDEVEGAPRQAAGVAALGAVRVLRHGEVFARAEQFWGDVEATGDTYGTVGLSYSLSAARGGPYGNLRITAAYTARRGVSDDMAHLFVVQTQVVF